MYEYHNLYDMESEPHNGCLLAAVMLAVAWSVILLSVMLGGCARPAVQIVERTHTDTLIMKDRLRDSIFIHDSIAAWQQPSGDTLYIYKVRVRTEYRDRMVHDTVYMARVDSVPVPYPVVKEVNRLRWWQRALAWMGAVSVIAIILLFLRVSLRVFS